jgi:hypothetical protein
MTHVVFSTISLALFLAAMVLHVVIIRAPDLKDPGILGIVRRIRIGAWAVVSIPVLFDMLSQGSIDNQTSPGYATVALILLACSDIFISMGRIFGFIDISEPTPLPKNVFSPLSNSHTEEPYVTGSASDNSKAR